MALRERLASTGYVVCRGWLREDELERMAESAATLHECEPGRQNMRTWAWACRKTGRVLNRRFCLF